MKQIKLSYLVTGILLLKLLGLIKIFKDMNKEKKYNVKQLVNIYKTGLIKTYSDFKLEKYYLAKCAELDDDDNFVDE